MSRNKLPGRCELCPMPDQPFVRGYGDADGPMIIGEAPGATEVAKGIPFVGQAGRVLRATLSACAMEPERCFITNSVSCRPPGNATPDLEHLSYCHDRLEREVKLVQPTKILLVGSVALTSALGATKAQAITKWRGRGFYTEWQGQKVYTLATYHPAAILRDTELYRDFANDVYKWSLHDKPIAQPIIDELICNTEKSALRSLKLLLEAADDTIISCDLETTGKNPYVDTTIAVGVGTVYDWTRMPEDTDTDAHGLAVIIPIHLLQSKVLRQALRGIAAGDTFRGTLGFQNMKFDLKMVDYLYEEFLRPKKPMDSMLLSYVLDERPIGRFQAHGLKAQARIRYDAPDYAFDFDKHFKKTKDEQQEALPTMYHYQCQDLYYTARLIHDVRADVEKTPKLISVVNELLIPGTIAFAEMEMRGVQLDIDYLHTIRKDFEKRVSKQLKWLQAIALKYEIEDFNPLSAKQVGGLLYGKWKLPKPPARFTDRKELHDMVPKIKDPEKADFVRKLIEFRLDTKTLQTYINGLLERAGDDNRIRSNFQLVGTVTGRLASQNPNLQNIPGRHGALIRKAFVASDGYDFIEADFNQLELRVAAALSNEKAWVEAFKSGRDVHKMVAAAMLNKKEVDVTEFERRIAKTVDFGILYGRGAKSLMEGQELKHLPEGTEWWNLEEAIRFQREFMEMFPNIKKWMDETKEFAVKNHYVEAPSGRRRRFPYIARNLHEVLRQAGNMPIQSTASDICLRGLIDLHNELPEGAYVLFSVHDAIYLEVETQLRKKVLKQIEETMLAAVPKVLGFVPEVPFAVKIQVTKRWAEEDASVR